MRVTIKKNPVKKEVVFKKGMVVDAYSKPYMLLRNRGDGRWVALRLQDLTEALLLPSSTTLLGMAKEMELTLEDVI